MKWSTRDENLLCKVLPLFVDHYAGKLLRSCQPAGDYVCGNRYKVHSYGSNLRAKISNFSVKFIHLQNQRFIISIKENKLGKTNPIDL